MKFRAHDWFDMEAFEPRYGIQARPDNSGWKHCAREGKPLLFKSREARDAEIDRLEQKAQGRKVEDLRTEAVGGGHK